MYLSAWNASTRSCELWPSKRAAVLLLSWLVFAFVFLACSYSQIRGRISPDLNATMLARVQWCMDKDEAQLYQSMSEASTIAELLVRAACSCLGACDRCWPLECDDSNSWER